MKQSTELSRIEPLFIIPEHKVPLPGGAAASQNDIWVLGKTDTHLVSFTVEGNVSEPFGPTAEEWFEDYQTFIDLFKLNAGINELVSTSLPNGIVLYFAWIHGDEKFLEI
nr:hypothetical protein [uncultured Desulfobacter sp.]